LEALKQRYGNQVEFLAIYVREAHPTDGWRMNSNDKAGIAIQQPRDEGERVKVARRCCSSLKISMPLLVDEMDDRVGNAYSGMPDRLYLIDRKGRIAYKSGRGPFGFKPGELEQSLILSLLDQANAATSAANDQSQAAPVRANGQHSRSGGRKPPESGVSQGAYAPRSGFRPLTVAALTNAEAWKKMRPYLDKEVRQALPVWIRALAVSLPRTAAAMLDLDYAQRAESTLPPMLRAKLRWIAADANRCDYAKAYARFDYVQAGGKAEDIDALPKQLDKLPEAERLALILVRQLVEAAYSVSDEQVARLVDLYGEKEVVAIVLVAAYANFQDRLLLALGATVEESGPLPPIKVAVKRTAGVSRPVEAPPAGSRRPFAPSTNPPPIPEKLDDPEWTALPFDTLTERVTKQIARRKARVHIPTWEQIRDRFPADLAEPDKPVRIQWSLLAFGHQPRLSAAWSRGLRAFRAESDLDPVFRESMFWVVTRSLQCFY
jgi:alkylhydroperoxidase family enzyme